MQGSPQPRRRRCGPCRRRSHPRRSRAGRPRDSLASRYLLFFIAKGNAKVTFCQETPSHQAGAERDTGSLSPLAPLPVRPAVFAESITLSASVER